MIFTIIKLDSIIGDVIISVLLENNAPCCIRDGIALNHYMGIFKVDSHLSIGYRIVFTSIFHE